MAGFHSHIGSQIMDARSFEKAIDTMTYFLAYVQREYGMEQTELSIGGGFGIKYLEEDQPISLGQMCKTMVKIYGEVYPGKGHLHFETHYGAGTCDGR